MKKIFVLAAFLGCSAARLWAQSLPVGSAADQYLRFLQLTNQTQNSSGLVSRPLSYNHSEEQCDSALNSLVRTALHYSFRKNIYAGILPLSLDQQYVSHHPFYQNDGAMIPAKGYQMQLSGGVYAKLGPLSFQLRPEFVYAANQPYQHNENFGSVPKGAYRQVFPGQSALGLAAGPVALTVSTENLWWGPGMHHSLVMTNQAPGFLHAKLHSRRPLKTPIGQFEWTLLGGRLQSNPSLPFDNENLMYKPADVFDRYLNAFVVSYQPKFIRGLSIGVTRGMQQYEHEVESSGESMFRKYLPVILKPIQKKNAMDDDTKTTDQLASAFFRWLWRKSKAEIYAEYGYNDYKKNIRDFTMNMPHAAAYMVGFKKAIALPDKGFVEAGIELLQMSQSPDLLVRNAGNWYEHGGIQEGYSNGGQVMGAAFASNAQTFQLSYQKGLQRTGFVLQRFQRDPVRAAPRWNDWVVSFSHSKPFKGFYLQGQLQCIRSKNYGWEQERNPVQIFAKTGVHYYFHD